MLQFLLLLLPLLSLSQTEGFREDQAVEAAKRAIRDELGVSESRLEPYQIFAAQWRDSSLGCPRSGMVYLPVLTRGYRVFLKETDAPSQLHEVHVAPGQAVVCETADPDVGNTLPRAGGERRARELRSAPRLARWAREDLAARLDVDSGDIAVSVVPRTWRDTSLGCPQEGQTYEPARIEGFLISLQIDNETYSYHADQENVFLCELSDPQD